MIISKRSPVTGKINDRDIPITQKQLENYLTSNECIQNVFPFLSADDREFIMTGIIPEEFPNEY
jgi:hypothetical protein